MTNNLSRRRRWRTCFLLTPAILTGCATTEKNGLMIFGPNAPTINRTLNLKPESNDARATADEVKKAVWAELNIGNTIDNNKRVEVSDYAAAGYNYVDRQCNSYFDKLILLQNQTAFGNDMIGAGGATTGAILGLAKVSSMAIGIVAAGFGFAGSVVTSFDRRALLTPYPEETKTLIIDALNKYRAAYPPRSMQTPAEAIANVQRYAELCTYSGITRAAKQALSSAKGEIVAPTSPETMVLGAAIATKLELSSPLDDAQTVALYWLLNKGGAPCSPPNSCTAAVGRLPKPLQDKIYDATTKTYLDLKPIKDVVGIELDRYYASDAAFKRLADAFPSDPPAPAPAPAPAKPVAKQAAPVAPVAAVPVPAAAEKQSALTNRYQFKVDALKNSKALSTEHFGQFSFQRPADAETEKPNE